MLLAGDPSSLTSPFLPKSYGSIDDWLGLACIAEADLPLPPALLSLEDSGSLAVRASPAVCLALKDKWLLIILCYGDRG